MSDTEGVRPTDSPFIDATEYPCDICGRMHDCEPCEHCSFSTVNAAALRTILADETKNPGDVLSAARDLARSGDWAADAIVSGRVRHRLRQKFGPDTVSALFDHAPVDQGDGEPWEPLALDNGAFSEPPAPLAAVGRGLLLFGRAVVSIVTHGKQGKTTTIWADAAPVTHRGRVAGNRRRSRTGTGRPGRIRAGDRRARGRPAQRRYPRACGRSS